MNFEKILKDIKKKMKINGYVYYLERTFGVCLSAVLE